MPTNDPFLRSDKIHWPLSMDVASVGPLPPISGPLIPPLGKCRALLHWDREQAEEEGRQGGQS